MPLPCPRIQFAHDEYRPSDPTVFQFRALPPCSSESHKTCVMSWRQRLPVPCGHTPDRGAPVKERATVVCRRGDRILLVTRGTPLRWSLPGGTVQYDESPAEAAARELSEETTLRYDGFVYLFQFGGLSKRHHVYFVDVPLQARATASNEIAGCDWFLPEQISTLFTSVPTRAIVNMIFRDGHAGRFAPAR